MMLFVFCCSIAAFFEPYDKTALFMIINILLLILPLLIIVLYFLAGEEKSLPCFLLGLVQCVLEIVLIVKMDGDGIAHIFGFIITFMVIITPIIWLFYQKGGFDYAIKVLLGIAFSVGFCYGIYEAIKMLISKN
jgi:heme/copper-type cytochrome/quinol oxidase subunit 4